RLPTLPPPFPYTPLFRSSRRLACGIPLVVEGCSEGWLAWVRRCGRWGFTHDELGGVVQVVGQGGVVGGFGWAGVGASGGGVPCGDRKSTRLNSSHVSISY